MIKDKPYYTAYEKRYQAAYSAGADRWGHSPDDNILYNTLKSWVDENSLKGKSVIEYACGEGACGVILSELGCIYHGVDISPSAIAKAEKSLQKYANARVEVLDMVKESVQGKYDAALDCMGLHMLITDHDRASYLQNVYNSLRCGAPVLLFRESYRKEGTYNGVVDSIEEWIRITGDDYETPQLRRVRNTNDGGEIEILIPCVPARAKDRNGYTQEMENAGFTVEKFIEMDVSDSIVHSATVYMRKNKEIIDTRCGLRCEGCGYIESCNCKGCIATNGHPFHGECPVAICCQEKGFLHCGECPQLPCDLLTRYSLDPEHGDDPPGARIDQCRKWKAESNS